MKRWLARLVALVYLFALAGCTGGESGAENSGQESQHTPESLPQSSEISAVSEANGFTLTLFADKGSYSADEEIHIRADLVYTGAQEQITIWHGEPYIVFSITDGEDFSVDGIVMTILTSTQLTAREIYSFDYVKSGGFSADDPNAAFWEEFYRQPELKLPAGEYTVSVSGAFTLDEEQKIPSGLKCQLQLKVA